MGTLKLWRVVGVLCAISALLLAEAGMAAPLSQEGGPTVEPTVAPTEEPEETGGNFFCGNPTLQHPVGNKLATDYGVPYEDVMGWFCQEEAGYGFGQIMLALRTAKLTGEAPEGYLSRRTAGEGWGQIWQDVGLVGEKKEEGAGANNNGNGQGSADRATPPGQDKDKPQNNGASNNTEPAAQEQGPSNNNNGNNGHSNGGGHGKK